MDRPAYLREDLYEQIVEEIGQTPISTAQNLLRNYGYAIEENASRNEVYEAVLDRPSRYLAHSGILGRADLLEGLFIEFDDGELDDGHTYFINREAAEEIASGDPVIMLRSGREAALVPRERIEQAFRNGCVIDYSPRHSAEGER
jgi:hypothetical protein